MKKEEVYKEIEEMFGLVPTFMKMVPEATLELEWNLFKKIAVDETIIPNKYKELMGLAISSVTKCQYCLFYHTQLAILFGATPEEIEEAEHYAKNTASWSTYINGMQIDLDEFKAEISEMCSYVRDSLEAGEE